MSSDTLIRVEGVSKRFCRSLKRSLWYGVCDMAAELLPFGPAPDAASAPQLRHNEFWAVNDVSFELRRGECLGLIGRNGAGKTTLLRMLNGLIKPDAGRIEMRGRVGALIALGTGFNPILTGRENIYIGCSVLGLSKREIDAKLDDIIDFAEIGEFIDAPVQSYSSGMQVRLGFAVAAFQSPEILLIDEVLAVGDVAFQSKCFNALSRLRERGTCFILVSHSMHLITRYCDRVIYMRKGKLVVDGPCDESIADYIRDMNSNTESKDDESTDFSKAYGSGKIHITGARFLSDSGDPILCADPASAVTLRIDYHCPNPPLSNIVFDVLIRDRDGVFYQGTSTEAHRTFEVRTSNGYFDIRFPTLPTADQKLNFFIGAMDASTRELHDWKRQISIQTQGNPLTSGRVFLRPAWSVSENLP